MPLCILKTEKIFTCIHKFLPIYMCLQIIYVFIILLSIICVNSFKIVKLKLPPGFINKL